MMRYAYTEGDRLEERNTYCYTPSVGAEMLQAWLSSREALAATLPHPVNPPCAPQGRLPLPGEIIETGNLFDALYARVVIDDRSRPVLVWLHAMTRKFEVTKRVHRAYDEELKPIDGNDYRDLSLYVRLAEIMLAAYDKIASIQYLNVAMKIIDTVCSVGSSLDPPDAARLSGLIARERALVETLWKGAR